MMEEKIFQTHVSLLHIDMDARERTNDLDQALYMCFVVLETNEQLSNPIA